MTRFEQHPYRALEQLAHLQRSDPVSLLVSYYARQSAVCCGKPISRVVITLYRTYIRGLARIGCLH